MPRILVLVCMVAMFSTGLHAQQYPARPIRMIIPFTPGGAQDVIGRFVGIKLSEALGQQVVIDNRPGAGGVIGLELLAKALPDGYTLGIGAFGTLAINPTLHPKLPYDAVKSFQPITLVAKVPNLLTVSPALPVKSVKGLIELAKTKPGGLAYGSGGIGSGIHLTTEYFSLMAHVKLVHVPYKGTAPAVVGLLSGECAMVFAAIQGLAPHVRSGKIRALAVSTSKRLPVFPEVPTIAEDGLPGFEATQWYGVLAPAGTPRAVVNRLRGAIVDALRSPDGQERLAADASEPVGNSPEEFSAFIKSEIARWAPVVKASGARPE